MAVSHSKLKSLEVNIVGYQSKKTDTFYLFVQFAGL